VLDEDTVNNGSDDLYSIPIDDLRHRLVEMGVVVIVTRCLCSLEHEFANILDRRVSRVSCPFADVIECIGVCHFVWLSLAV